MRLLHTAPEVRAVEHGNVRAKSHESPVGSREAHTAPTGPARWMPQTKAKVLDDLCGGYISLEAACERYGLSIEEGLTWQRAMKRFGLAGLQVTKTQKYRQRLNIRHSGS